MQNSETVAEAIRLAMHALGGEAHIRDVREWIAQQCLRQWRDVGTAMADLAYPGNASSGYPVNARFLVRTGRGRYRLREASDNA